MTEYVWMELREHAIVRFGGQTPGAQLEQRLVEAFLAQPARVVEAIDRIGAKFAAGLVRSPWAVLAMDVEDAGGFEGARASDSGERDRAVLRAEQWLRAAGCQFPSWAEAEDELFGSRGSLRSFGSDAGLRERLRLLWSELVAGVPA